MGAPVRKQSSSVIEDLFTQSYKYEFHQAIKLLETSFSEAQSLGTQAFPELEVVSIKSRVQHSYPSSDLYELTPPKSKGSYFPCTLQVNFLGIAGPNGPLPMPYSEHLMTRARQGDTAFRDFLDLFNHRLLSLLHRIRKKYWVGLETATPEETAFAKILFSFIGLSNPTLRNRLPIPDRGLLYYSGLLWQQPRSAKGLEVFLSHYFDVPVEVKPLQGKWLQIDEEHQTKIGNNGHHQVLGDTASLGNRAWDIRSEILICVGPLKENVFHNFLPTGKAYKRLCALSHFYLGLHHTFKVNLLMKASDVETSVPGRGTRLGWTSWLKTEPFDHDDDQVVVFSHYSKEDVETH